jgi:hypothetical protein
LFTELNQAATKLVNLFFEGFRHFSLMPKNWANTRK